jgi:DNA-directed RNA polymerase subunit RPC12/RpoP
MKLTFACPNCRKSVLVDEAEVGRTIDCPECSKPVYVSTRLPIPQRESSTVVPETSTMPSQLTTGSIMNSKFPAIEGARSCLFISGLLVVAGTILFFMGRDEITLLLCSLATPFLIAALLSAVYTVCKGHVKQGLQLIAVVSVLVTLPLIPLAMFMSYTKTALTQVSQDLEKQTQQLNKMFRR